MNFNYERKKIREGYSHIIGCDEVGRGSLAGPVVSAAVILPVAAKNDKFPPSLKLWRARKVRQVYKVIKDSKLLTPRKREELSLVIRNTAIAWAVGEVEKDVIDEINIHNASLLSMRRAVDKLLDIKTGGPRQILTPDLVEGSKFVPSTSSGNKFFQEGISGAFLVLDGKFVIPKFHLEQEAIVDGDNKVLSIAAASIVAKVHRDSLMEQLGYVYPKYNFAKHKGYGTDFHRQMILRHGLSPIHRLSFCKNLA